LTPELRAVSGAIGVVSLAGGVLAIFFKNNNGGSVALIGVGAAFLLMAVTGYGIRSLKIGPSGVALDTLKFARQLHLQGDDEGAAEAVESLIRTPTPLLSQPVADTSMSRSLLSYGATPPDFATPEDYASAVHAALIAELSGRGLVLPDRSASAKRFEFLIRASEKTLGVEIRLGDKIRFDPFVQSVKLTLESSATPIDGVLVVVNTSADAVESLRAVASGDIGVPTQFVGWKTNDDPKPLLEAVRELVVLAKGSWGGP
jgi:hypothetical protein